VNSLELIWTPSAHARRLLSVAAIATLAAVLTGRAELLALAAPALLLLVSADRRPMPQSLRLAAEVSPDRCVEDDEIELAIEVDVDHVLGQVDLTLAPRGPVRLETPSRTMVELRTKKVIRRWQLRAVRWGRWTPASLTVVVRDRSRLWQATARCPVGDVTVYPRPATMNRLVIPQSLLDRIGIHTGRPVGSGVEFAGIRPYVAGDRSRDIHWPASLRRGGLQVIQHVAERGADVIVALDAFSDVEGSLERSVRGCAGVARAYLRSGDRVGLVVLGGILTWLRPDTGQRTLYRITEAVLAVRLDDSVVTPDLARVPRHALPPSALVVLFSPLLDDRALATIEDLRGRGVTLLIVDVLTREPQQPRRPGVADDLALRLWRLDRIALRYRLGQLGITVVGWDERTGLDEVLAPLHARPVTGRAR
jgi:uncharacterized protein (DUF58 family)